MTQMDQNSEIVQLNILTTYPVNWDRQQMITDFVQNFYDSIGSERFGRDFTYELRDGVLTMSGGKGFDKEWLYYLGVSSKHAGDGNFAGGFGEGFKIAALTAIRDFNLEISMESRNWRMHVTTKAGQIEGKNVEFLAYAINERSFSEDAVLFIKNADQSLLEMTEKAVNRFYYDENKYFGKCLYKHGPYAIYETTGNNAGALYTSRQYRSKLDVPLIICNNSFEPEEDDRDRKSLSLHDTRISIQQVMRAVPPETALIVLEKLKSVWYRTRQTHGRSINWQYSLKYLINKISLFEYTRREFEEKFGKNLIIPYDRYYSPSEQRIARSWYQMNNLSSKYRLVSDSFSVLGVRTICQLCDKEKGFITERLPYRQETALINVLKEAVRGVLSELIGTEDWPECYILTNKEAPASGYAALEKTQRTKSENRDFTVVARAGRIAVHCSLLKADCFAQAFVTYSHELLHRYGGDSTMQFHLAIVRMNELILDHTEILEECEEKWRKILRKSSDSV